MEMIHAIGKSSTGELTDSQYVTADKIELWLQSHPGPHSPSRIARGIGCGTGEARAVLEWMDKHIYVDATGNGYWRNYQSRTL